MALTLLEVPGDHSFTKNRIPFILQSSLGYGAYFEIILQMDQDYYLSGGIHIATQRLYVDNTGLCELNAQDIYDAGFTTFSHPDLTFNTEQQILDKIRVGYYEINEYASDGTLHDSYSSQFDVYRGGVPMQYDKTGIDINWFIDNTRWLTWKPAISIVSTRTPEFLCLKTPTDNSITTVLVIYHVEFDSGNSYDFDLSFATNGTSGLDMFHIPCGYDVMNFGALEPGSNPTFYTVVAVDKDNPLTILAFPRKYIIDPYERPFERFFMFTNSLGGVDTLRTIGQAVPKLTYEDTESDVGIPVSRGVNTAPTQILDSVEDETKQLNTGFRTKAEVDWLRDFRLSKDVYELDLSDMETLIPIRFLKKDLVTSKDDQDMHAVIFEYHYAYKNTVYSGIPVR
jgi:hypothetical protein